MAKYYSRSKGKFIDIANMPDQYVRNAFVKMCNTDTTEDVVYAQQQKERADKMEMAKMNINRELLDAKEIIKEKDLAIYTLRSSLDHNVSEHKKLTDTLDEMGMYEPDAKDKLKDTVSKQAYQIMWDNCEKLKKDLDKANNKIRILVHSLEGYIPKGDLKMFSEIPNTDDGWEFVRLLKKYLNNVSYKLRVRGQYLDDETKKNEGWQRYSFGQPIEKSKCLRVYVDINNKDVD